MKTIQHEDIIELQNHINSFLKKDQRFSNINEKDTVNLAEFIYELYDWGISFKNKIELKKEVIRHIEEKGMKK
jgi:DNA-binding transcriptional regulator YhcF (GntR family)